MLYFTVTLFENYILMQILNAVFECHQRSDICKGGPTAKESMRDVLPICQMRTRSRGLEPFPFEIYNEQVANNNILF